jgi:uncharacterized delta-60 repeat protein
MCVLALPVPTGEEYVVGKRLAVVLVLLPTLALAARGDLDPTFGSGGTVASTLAIDRVSGLVLQSDGRIVVTGSREAYDGSGVFFVARYGADGSLDTGFGSDGNGTVTEPGEFDPALLVDADGSLVVASTRCDTTGCVARLRRYDADGHADPTFAAADRFIAAPTVAEVVVRQADGRLVVGGNAGHAPFFSVWLARYNADGTNDPTFGDQGLWSKYVSAHGSSLGSLAVQGDDSLVGGVTASTGESSYSSIGRFLASGAEASSVPVSFAYPIVALAPGGGVLSAGTLVSQPAPAPSIAFARFGSDLQPDGTFGDGGMVTGPTGSPGAILVGPDGSVVAAVELGDIATRRFALLSFTAGGAPDTSFGAQGIAVAFPDQSGGAQRVVRQADDGKLVAAGRLGPPAATSLVLARFLEADGAASTTSSSTTTTTLAGGPPPTSASSTSTTLPPAGGCTGAAECDDGNACTVDACDAGRCVHDAVVGFDAVTCICAAPALACDTTAVTGRMDKACTLLARAGDARVGRARRLIRRALHLLGVDQRAMAKQAAPNGGCDPALAHRIDDLQRRTHQLLQRLR